jgi:hypothetical protein
VGHSIERKKKKEGKRQEYRWNTKGTQAKTQEAVPTIDLL